jgi:hypothetical protein
VVKPVWAHADNRENARAARRARDVPLVQPCSFADVAAAANKPHALLRAALMCRRYAPPLRAAVASRCCVNLRGHRAASRDFYRAFLPHVLPLRDQHTA